MRRIVVALMVTMAPDLGHADKAPPRFPDPHLLAEITRTQNYTLGRPFAFAFTPDGRTLLFLRSGPEDPTTSLWALDIETNEEREVLNAGRLLDAEPEQLSPEERAIRERKRVKISGITSVALSTDGRRAVFKVGGEVWIWDRETDLAARLRLPSGPILHPSLSPDGKRLAFVRHENVYVMRIGAMPEKAPERGPRVVKGRVRALTRDGDPDQPRGRPEFVAQEEMDRHEGLWWSPDSKWIAYQANDYSAMERFSVADPSAPEKETLRMPYPRPGGANAVVRLYIVGTDGKGRREVPWDRERYPYLARVTWSKKAPLSLLVQSRDQKRQTFLRFDPKTGHTVPMHRESDPAWLNLSRTTPRWLSNGRAYLWATEEGSSWRLELHEPRLSSRKGGLKQRTVVVEETAGYRELVHVDEKRNRAWFTGGPDPTQQALYVAPLMGGGPSRTVSPEVPGVYGAHFARTGNRFVLVRQSLTTLPHASVHRVPDSSAAEPEPPRRLDLASGLTIRAVATEPRALPHVEIAPPRTETELYAFIVRPSDHAPDRRYPVILYVYGGPHHNVVRRDATHYFLLQWLADHGFVVVGLDGRGTPYRGREWERAIRGDLAGVPLEEQVRGLRQLGARVGELDLDRVGVFGWSFGGFMAALAVLRRPDIFRVGVAGAPVTDWRYYDTHYTERYLGLLDESPEAYARSSVLTAAGQLARPLLLVHGVADDNVFFVHTLKLADALFHAGKDYAVLPLASSTHQVTDPAVREALYGRIVRFLGEALW